VNADYDVKPAIERELVFRLATCSGVCAERPPCETKLLQVRAKNLAESEDPLVWHAAPSQVLHQLIRNCHPDPLREHCSFRRLRPPWAGGIEAPQRRHSAVYRRGRRRIERLQVLVFAAETMTVTSPPHPHRHEPNLFVAQFATVCGHFFPAAFVGPRSPV